MSVSVITCLSSSMYRRAGKEPSRYLGSVRRRVLESQSLAAQTRGPLPGNFGGRAVSASTCPEYVGPSWPFARTCRAPFWPSGAAGRCVSGVTSAKPLPWKRGISIRSDQDLVPLAY